MKPLSARTLSLVFLAWLVVFWLSYVFIAGLPEVMGNRRLAAYPSGEPVLSSAWMQKVAAWAIEHSPFRYHAIVTRNRFSYETARVLHPLPVNPGHSEVTIGKEGWLFSLDEAPENRSKRDLERMADDALWLAQAVSASGRRFLFMPVPDKSSVYADYAGTQFRWADRNSRRSVLPAILDSRFQHTPQAANYLPLWQPMQQALRDRSELLYWEHDTHWNPAGMVVAVPLLIERLQPGLWEPTSLHETGIVSFHGDLMKSFLLQNIATTGTDFAVQREGPAPRLVSTQSVPGFAFTPIQRFHSDHPRVVKGRTLFVCDSFTEAALPLLTPWFEDVTFAHYSYTGSTELPKLIRDSQTIVFVSVERFLRWRLHVWNSNRKSYILDALSQPPPAPQQR